MLLSLAGSQLALAAPTAPMTLSYAVNGGGTAAQPVLDYVIGGQSRQAFLTTAPVTYQMDAGKPWSVSQELTGSTSTLRWKVMGQWNGSADGTTKVFKYFRQYFVTFNVYNYPGQPFLLPFVNYTSLGITRSVQSGLPGDSVWADFNSTYRYGNSSSTPPLARWYGSGRIGLISSSTTIVPVYRVQDKLTITLRTSGPDILQSATVVGTFGGDTFSQTVMSPASAIWLDQNTSFSLQPTVYSATGDHRWIRHYVSSSVTRYLQNVNATYIEQFPLSVAFSVSNGAAPSGPVISAYTNNSLISVQSFSGAPPVWVDVKSSYTVSKLLAGSTSIERWTSQANASGVIVGTTTVNIEYFHQVQVAFSTSVAGGGSIGSSNAFYEFLGSQTIVPLSPARTNIWVDVGSDIVVQGTFAGQSNLERWELGTSPSIPIQKPQNLTLVYYHQMELQFTYSVQEGGSATPPVVAGFALGVHFTSPFLSGNSAWLDVGTPWSISEYLQSSAQGERWAALTGENGTVGQQASFNISYVHEYLVALTTNSASAGTLSQGGWVQVGHSIRISVTPANGWAFARWIGTGQGSYSGPNGTASIEVMGPIQESARFDVRLIVQVSGSGSVQAQFGHSSYSVGGSPVTFYVIPGSNVTLVAKPSLFDIFTGWHGIRGGTTGAVAFVTSSPLVVTASFGVDLVLVYGILVLYLGVAVFVIFYLLRNRRFSLGRLRRIGRSEAYNV